MHENAKESGLSHYSKWRLKDYHHMSFNGLRVELSGSASDFTSLPTGMSSEIILED